MGLWERLFGYGKDRQLSFVVIGLDNAGKTTLLNWIKPENKKVENRKIQPTIGFEVEQFEYDQVKLTTMDMAGQGKYRDMWTSRLDECHGVVFVVDSSDSMRLCVAKEELQRVLLNDIIKSRKMPFLFFANKADLPKAVNTTTLMRELSLDLITDRPWKLLSSDAVKGSGVDDGFTWLVDAAKQFKSRNFLIFVTQNRTRDIDTMLDPLNSTLASSLAAEAAQLETQAMSSDRRGDVAMAISFYTQAASKLSDAASQLPVTSPDTRLILNHRIEVLKRVDYLQTLFPGQTPQIPIDSHITSLALGQPVTSTTPPSTPSGASGPSATVTTAAALGGITGLVLLGPLTAVAGAAGLAYAATRTDTAVGSGVRAVASTTNKAVAGAGEFDKKHGLSTKAKELGSVAYKRTVEFENKHHVGEKIKNGVVATGKKISEINAKYHITDKAASAIGSGMAKITSWLGGSSSSVPGAQSAGSVNSASPLQ